MPLTKTLLFRKVQQKHKFTTEINLPHFFINYCPLLNYLYFTSPSKKAVNMAQKRDVN